MAKTNYSKVEDAFNDGIIKMNAEHLLEMTEKKSPNHEQDQILIALNSELKYLEKFKNDVYEKVGLSKKELKKFISDPESIGPQDWEKIKKIKDEVVNFKKEIEKTLPNLSNDELVTQQRTKQRTKRFNVNDNWLPLQ